MKQPNLDKAKNLIKQSKTIAVIPSDNFSIDSFSAAVGIYNLLLNEEKQAQFVYSQEIPKEVEDLISKNELTPSARSRELLVSIDYSGTDAASAHYSTDADVLEVRISPIPKDFPKVGKVRAKLVGFEADTIIFIGNSTKSFEDDYGHVEDVNIIRISNVEIDDKKEEEILLVDNTCDMLSQQVFKIASKWGFVPTKKVTAALLKGISS